MIAPEFDQEKVDAAERYESNMRSAFVLVIATPFVLAFGCYVAWKLLCLVF